MKLIAVFLFFILLTPELLPARTPQWILRDSNGRAIRYAGKLSSRPVMLSRAPVRRDEFRGVWVATVKNLDFRRSSSIGAFKKSYIDVVNRIASGNFNAIIFQIRPNCDAFYPSKFAPYSASLTGVEGRGFAGFDPLKFMISEAHKRNLEFHAWLNPYRVVNDTKLSKAAYLRTRHPENFARKNPQAVLAFKNGMLFLDPGKREVIQHVVDVVHEIVSKYNVDAIHLDDYFYPYDEIGTLDEVTYRHNNPSRLGKAEWRRSNTRMLIYSLHRTIKAVNARTGRRVKFGVSPFGIWANKKSHPAGSLTDGKQTFFNLYADTYGWVRAGYVDYIAPQLYWHFAHDTAAYAALVDWWSKAVRGTAVKLYIGHGVYRSGSAGWGRDELINQMRFNRMHPEVDGSIFFSYRHLFGAEPDAGALRLRRFIHGANR